MTRSPVEWEVSGVTVRSTPLPYERAEDSLPDVFTIVVAVVERAKEAIANFDGGLDSLLKLEQKDLSKFLPVIVPILSTLSDKLGGGKLKQLAPLIMWSTEVVMENDEGTKEIKQLSKLSDRRDVFDSHPDLYFPILFFAGKVTYARFFPGIARPASEKSEKVTS